MSTNTKKKSSTTSANGSPTGSVYDRRGEIPSKVRDVTAEALVQARDASTRAVRNAFEKTAEASTKLSTGQKIAVGVGAVGAAVAAGFAAKRLAEGSNRRAKKAVYHLEPCEDGWRLRRADADRAEARFDTKSAGMDEARDLVSDRAPSELIVHLADGSEQTRHQYEA